MPATIFIVYNANTGFFQGAFDSLHKAISPDTYPCKLCALTHGYLSMRSQWRDFVRKAQAKDFQFEVLHKDELHKWPFNFHDIPGIYQLKDGNMEMVIGKNTLDQIGSLAELIEKLEWSFGIVNTSAHNRVASYTH